MTFPALRRSSLPGNPKEQKGLQQVQERGKHQQAEQYPRPFPGLDENFLVRQLPVDRSLLVREGLRLVFQRLLAQFHLLPMQIADLGQQRNLFLITHRTPLLSHAPKIPVL
jgi:hypothetical protein